MRAFVKGCLDHRFGCLVTRPVGGMVAGGLISGAFGLLGGLAYGAFHHSPDHAVTGGWRLASAGAVAGLIAGLWSGLDRMSWPADERELLKEPDPKNKAAARFPASPNPVIRVIEACGALVLGNGANQKCKVTSNS